MEIRITDNGKVYTFNRMNVDYIEILYKPRLIRIVMKDGGVLSLNNTQEVFDQLIDNNLSL